MFYSLVDSESVVFCPEGLYWLQQVCASLDAVRSDTAGSKHSRLFIRILLFCNCFKCTTIYFNTNDNISLTICVKS